MRTSETTYEYTDKAGIEALLLGRRVVKVDDHTLRLDDGTTLKLPDTDGGCACSAGCYDLTELNGVDNVITKVEFEDDPAGDYEDPYREYGYYRIFVFADNQRINLATWKGSDGNGYYGTGYEIRVAADEHGALIEPAVEKIAALLRESGAAYAEFDDSSGDWIVETKDAWFLRLAEEIVELLAPATAPNP